MIRHAKISEIDHILAITRACAKAMAENGIYQWNDAYPSRKAFETDIERSELYVSLDDERIIGGVVISDHMDTEYVPIQWLTESGKNIYVHRLFVHPQFQGLGKAQQLMDFAEGYARKHGYASVRLDTFSQNPRNNRFYAKRGYQRLGDIFFPKQSTHPFHCYELPL